MPLNFDYSRARLAVNGKFDCSSKSVKTSIGFHKSDGFMMFSNSVCFMQINEEQRLRFVNFFSYAMI